MSPLVLLLLQFAILAFALVGGEPAAVVLTPQLALAAGAPLGRFF